MSGGGIIIQRASVIFPAIKDPSLYDSLPPQCKSVVDAILSKALADITDYDLAAIAAMIQVAVHC